MRTSDVPPTFKQQIVEATPTLKQPVPSDLAEPAASVPKNAAVPFRPSLRPPTAVVAPLLDDGNVGEIHVVRTSPYRFGRTDGNLVIPHDTLISGSHCELQRCSEGGKWHWYLKDLDSRNGTFVKVSRAPLRDGSMLLLGRHRYRFETGSDKAPDTDTVADPSTRAWAIPTSADIERILPSLVRLSPEGTEESRFVLSALELTVGSDPKTCQVVLADDPTIDSAHAKFYQDTSGRWHVDDLNSKNGSWFAIVEQRIDSNATIQIGEQRIQLRFP